MRESYREDGKVKKRTVANLTGLPEDCIAAVAAILEGHALVPAGVGFETTRTTPHGHVDALLTTLRRIGLDDMIASKPCRERSIIMALIVERILHSSSKLAATRLWHTTTLAEELDLAGVGANDVYAAMDWLVARQERIEKKLAGRHLGEGSALYYDLSSSYYEGQHCPLAQYGYSRDGKRGLPIIEYGVMTDRCGRPLAISVYEGGTSDSETVADQLEQVRTQFGLQRVVFVGDRGMLTELQIETVKNHPGLGWVSALRATAIQKLAQSGALQMSLFDQRNLAEITTPEYPGERLVACYNPILADDRKKSRAELLAATEKDLEQLRRRVARRTKKIMTAAEIGVSAGARIKRYKMGKHFSLQIGAGTFAWTRKQASIDKEAALDGIYVIRTSEPAKHLSAADAVRAYKGLAETERVFRGMKGVANHVRPIFHRRDPRVRAHLFISMLAYYLEWHLRDALTPLLFDDEARREVNAVRDPVAPAQPSPAARRKKVARQTSDGLPVHSLQTLLKELGTICRNVHVFHIKNETLCVRNHTTLTPLQAEVYRRLGCRQ
ncbi:MAG: IS1634 family transposase [bacterium]|nr:IS1634 family transposase [bacterium]